MHVNTEKKPPISEKKDLNECVSVFLSQGRDDQYTLTGEMIRHVVEVKSQMVVKYPWPEVKVFSANMPLVHNHICVKSWLSKYQSAFNGFKSFHKQTNKMSLQLYFWHILFDENNHIDHITIYLHYF